MTRQHIGFTFDPRDMLLSLQTGFTLAWYQAMYLYIAFMERYITSIQLTSRQFITWPYSKIHDFCNVVMRKIMFIHFYAHPYNLVLVNGLTPV